MPNDDPKSIADYLREKYGKIKKNIRRNQTSFMDKANLNFLGFHYMPISVMGELQNQRSEFVLKLDAYQRNLLEFDLKLNRAAESTTRVDDLEPAWKTEQTMGLFEPQGGFHSPTIQQKSPQNVFMFGRGQRKIKVEIYRGNLVKQQVDVIVNAANSRLILGGEVIILVNDFFV